MLLAASDNASASVRAKALHRAAEMDGYLGNFDRGIALGAEALELARASGDKWNAAWSLAVLGLLRFRRDANDVQTIPQMEEALALSREIGDTWDMSFVLRRLSMLLQARGNYDRASVLLEEAVALARRAGDEISLAESLLHLSTTERDRGADLARVTALANMQHSPPNHQQGEPA
jgi:tetratricopeptide (TPR) repeat protein